MTAELFAKEGAKVHAGDLIFPEPFDAPGIVSHVLDVTSLENLRSVVDAVIDAHGRIDILFAIRFRSQLG